MKHQLLFAALLLSGHHAIADLPPLIPRTVLFGAAEYLEPSVSPDGTRFAWLAPDGRGVLQIWMRTINGSDSKQVSFERRRPIYRYQWAANGRAILYLQDSDGDENEHLYAIDLASGNVRDLTPWQGARVDDFQIRPNAPHEVLAAINVRDRSYFDMHRIDLRTGGVTLDTRNPGKAVRFVVDAKLVVRGALAFTTNGGTELSWRRDGRSPWIVLLAVDAEEVVDWLDFTASGKSAILVSSLVSDTARLVERDLASGHEKEIASDPDVDIDSAIIHPMRRVVQAVPLEKGMREWKILDEAFRDDFERVRRLGDGAVSLISRDHADRIWILEFRSDRGPIQYYAFDRETKGATLLGLHRPQLTRFTLAPMKSVAITSRDGMRLPGYLTLPQGVDTKGLPLVLLPHGGPWWRDKWGFNRDVQLLANRGYAVLQVNFRGSTGYGKAFLHAGDRQWGRRMQDDLVDAVQWAIAEGITDASRVAIYGSSYGGYAALAGATLTPGVFRCSVDMFGISNLLTFLKSIPPYWASERSMADRRIGNPDLPEEAESLKQASPLTFADRIKIPMLIAQGANDVRVVPAESEQIVAAIERQGGRATYVLYTDEGHGFRRPANAMDFAARSEQFLADCLGGRFEPLAGDRYPGSSAVVKEVMPAELPKPGS